MKSVIAGKKRTLTNALNSIYSFRVLLMKHCKLPAAYLESMDSSHLLDISGVNIAKEVDYLVYSNSHSAPSVFLTSGGGRLAANQMFHGRHLFLVRLRLTCHLPSLKSVML